RTARAACRPPRPPPARLAGISWMPTAANRQHRRSDTMTFLQALASQRWDDHRYYHHSRINQSLHLVSALAFIPAYALTFVNTLAGVRVGGLVGMPSRQCGYFWFEPKGYDEANHATHEYKEQVKVGYNLRRKVVLLSTWALSPLILVVDPTLFGTLAPHTS